MPMPYFFLEAAFTVRQADALELDETFRSVDDDVDLILPADWKRQIKPKWHMLKSDWKQRK